MLRRAERPELHDSHGHRVRRRGPLTRRRCSADSRRCLADSRKTLLGRADAALYAAKRSGENRTSVRAGLSRYGPRVDFAGQVAVVTGAGSGIGRSTALPWAAWREGARRGHRRREGRNGGIAARRPRPRTGRQRSRRGRGVRRSGVRRRRRSRRPPQQRRDRACRRRGGHTLEERQRVLGVNLMGVVHGVHYFVPRMLRQGRPSTWSTRRRSPASCPWRTWRRTARPSTRWG